MKRRLGKGLSEIIPSYSKSTQNVSVPETSATTSNFIMLKLDQIRVGRFQPRDKINELELEDLKASIKKQGVIEPVIVRPVAHGTYELVAGERRYRASQAIGNKEVPAIVKQLSEKEAVELSLVENIQRENLNPMEEARGYAKLLDDFGYTQEDVAETIGKNRATVSNMLRLLKLPEVLQQALQEGAISLGHAKVLLGVESAARQLELFQKTVREGLSVRQVEIVVTATAPSIKRKNRKSKHQITPLENELRRALGTKVNLTSRTKGGRIIIDYFSQEDLGRLLEIFGVSEQWQSTRAKV